MLKRVGLFVCDLIAIAGATLLALAFRDNFNTSQEQLHAFLPYLGGTVAVAALTMVITGLNRRVWRLSGMHDYLRIVGVVILTVSVAMALGFLTNRLENVSRALPVLQLILMIFALVGLRVTAVLFFSWKNKSVSTARAVPDFARDIETVLLVGLNRLTNLYLRSIEDFADGRVRIAGILETQRGYHGRSVGAHAVLGAPEEAAAIIKRLAVHGVFVSRIVVMLPRRDLTDWEQDGLLSAAHTHPVTLEYFAETLGLVPDPRTPTAAHEVKDRDGMHRDGLWQFSHRPYWRLKRALDAVLSLLLLVLLSPLFIIVALLVMVDVGFPIVFWQQRPGTRGIPFHVYKFRTMGAAHDGGGQTLPDDDRVSKIGALLRATRLDELPQLFNVLIGDMSFVGPRPLLPVDQFPGLEARLAIAPGITGWAQINGGREVSAADKAAMDIWYLKNASLLIDVKICLATLRMLVKGEQSNVKAIEAAWRELQGRPSFGPPAVVPPPVREDGPEGASGATQEANIIRLPSMPRQKDKGTQAIA